jgi:hypothetical protein
MSWVMLTGDQVPGSPPMSEGEGLAAAGADVATAEAETEAELDDAVSDDPPQAASSPAARSPTVAIVIALVVRFMVVPLFSGAVVLLNGA